MSQYVSTKLVGIIAFIMIFTYTAEAIIFMDVDSASSKELETATSGTFKQAYLSFIDWLNKNYAEQRQLYYENPVIQDVFGHESIHWLLFGLQYSNHIFERFAKGTDWWNADETTDKQKLSIQTYYKRYLRDFGLDFEEDAGTLSPKLKKYQQNFLEQAASFLAKIPEGIGRIWDMLSFNIKDSYGSEIIPGEARIFLNIFFVPMWIILLIEIVPLLAKVIEAIGQLIPF